MFKESMKDPFVDKLPFCELVMDLWNRIDSTEVPDCVKHSNVLSLSTSP